jgi:catalase
MRVDGNYGEAKGYEPNSFGQWQQQPEFREPSLPLFGDAWNWDHREDEDYFSQPGNLFRLLSNEKKELLFSNTAAAIGGAQKFIQVRHIQNCYKADPDYGAGIANALGIDLAGVILSS